MDISDINESNNDDININLLEFSKIIKDLINDINLTFSDKVTNKITNNKELNIIYNLDLSKYEDNIDDKEELQAVTNIYNYCKTVYPERFFDILYQNDEIFNNTLNTSFLPDIDFSELYFDTTSSQTKETIWKYLQLILFSIITSIDNKDYLGNNAQLFEAINSDEFKNKLEDTMKEMEKLFNFKNFENMNNTSDNINSNNDFNDISMNGFNFNEFLNSMTNDTSNNAFDFKNQNFQDFFNSMKNDNSNNNFGNNANFDNLPNTETIHDHINNLINGKIGSLAKELAEEATAELDIDPENVNDVNDVFKQLFKNPGKLMGLVNNIGKKLDSKMKDGSLKESELLEEASSIFKNMKNMPGMNNFDELFKSMNLDQFMPKGAKFNKNAFQNMMDTNIKMSKMKERMKKKAENKQNNNTGNIYSQNYSENKNDNNNSNNLDDLNANLSSLMKEMEQNNSFIQDIIKNQNLNKESNNTQEVNNNENTKKRKTNNKKKVNKKK